MTRCRESLWTVVAITLLPCWLCNTVAGAKAIRAPAQDGREADSSSSSANHGASQIAFPGEEWETRKPEQVGLDAEKLDAFARSVGGTGIVVRDGYLVESWGDPSERSDWASASKPVMSTLLFFAVQEDRLSSVNDLVRPWVQQRWPGSDLIEKDRTMTFRHLADMTSGYARAELPGTHWAYNDYAITLYGETLTEVYGRKSLNDVAVERFAALDLQDGGLFGSRGGLGLDASARDFARIGWFWLNRGKWKDRLILEQKFLDDHLAPDVPKDLPRTNAAGSDYLSIGSHGGRGIQNRGGGSDQSETGPNVYGFNWWFNTELPAENGGLFMPSLPRDAFQANGHWGKEVMLIVPSWRLVVAARGDWGGMALEKAQRLAQAIVPEDTSPRESRSEQDPLQGPFPKWSKIEIEFRGPDSQGHGEPNPFAIPLDVTFTGPGGEQFCVPGFFDGDGDGGLDGNVWKVRFSADTTGDWTFQASSARKELDGKSGHFLVTEVPADAQGFWKWGRLESISTPENHIRYLKFRDGPYWLKAGCDDPENFLGKSENFDTLNKRKTAIDYLAARGINSMYILTHNIAGDNNDVWPWLGSSPEEAKKNADRNARFDVAKLEQWRELFEHMQNKGVVPYLILEDDSAWHDYDHARYYRELVARFGYLPALVFNVGEEQNENYRLAEALNLAQRLREIDPYDHPLGMHNVNQPDDRYVDASQVDITSIQTGSPDGKAPDPLSHNQLAIDWIEKCKARDRRVLMVGFDEGRPEEDRRIWWSTYLGGGVWEAHVRPPYDRPLSTWDKVWTELSGARAFMESLPFWDMQPNNACIVEGEAFCLAQPGVAYALYLPRGGGVVVDLAPDSAYEAAWWSPDNGQDGQPQNVTRVDGGQQPFEAPGPGDWALRIVATHERDCSAQTFPTALLDCPASRCGTAHLQTLPPSRLLEGEKKSFAVERTLWPVWCLPSCAKW